MTYKVTNDFNILSNGENLESRMFEHYSKDARKRGEKEIEFANDTIRNEYRKRLKDTREMKDKMEHIQKQLKTEISLCEVARGVILLGLRNFEPSLILNKQWSINMRDRPSSPSLYFETILKSVSQNNKEIQTHISELVDTITLIDACVVKLNKLNQILSQEINTKMDNMIIDNVCIEELIQPGDVMDTSDKGLMPQSALNQSSKLYTEREWANKTDNVVSSTVSQIGMSQCMRKEAMRIMKSLTDSGKFGRCPSVLDAFTAHLNYSQKQCTSLDANISLLKGRIDHLHKEKTILIGLLENIIRNLKTNYQRLSVRTLLPAKEHANQDVEATLEVEITNMKATECLMREKLTECEKRQVTQEQLLERMVQERAYRNSSVELDTACLKMQLLSCSSSGSGASTAGYMAHNSKSEMDNGRLSSRRKIPVPPYSRREEGSIQCHSEQTNQSLAGNKKTESKINHSEKIENVASLIENYYAPLGVNKQFSRTKGGKILLHNIKVAPHHISLPPTQVNPCGVISSSFNHSKNNDFKRSNNKAFPIQGSSSCNRTPVDLPEILSTRSGSSARIHRYTPFYSGK
eukprot:Tbor_TRINITY_DN5555_c4_g6::TRINITY_DN5555_c4_g6_i1::g.13300::m.13300